MTKKAVRFLAPLALVSALGLGPHLVGAADGAGPGAAAMPATSASKTSTAPVPAARTLSASAVPAVRRTVAAPAAVAPLAAPGLEPAVAALAESAARNAVARGLAESPRTLTVIDYSLPSTAKRLWVFDLETRDVLFHELVAHGKNTGDNLATRFSNTLDSKQTSLGLFRTANTYVGSNGYSLRLHGLDRGFNDRAFDRAIVIHGAPYVSEDFARAQGRIGRSWGCPALDDDVSREVIDTIAGGDLVFAFYPQPEFLRGSELLAGTAEAESLLVKTAGSATALAAR